MIARGADLCIALHRSITTSKRTKDCIRQSLAAGIPTFLIEDERAIPRRIEAGDQRLRPPDLRDFDLEPSPEVRRGLRSNRPVAGGCRDT